MMIVDIRYEDPVGMQTVIYSRFVVQADDQHNAADLATAEYKRLGRLEWSKSSIFKIVPVGSVYGPIHIQKD